MLVVNIIHTAILNNPIVTFLYSEEIVSPTWLSFTCGL
ncbi:hypothetical protein M7I_8142 [Glarea lozoyensis 74030]|uniref:Uncharacterized protein n=1 Tax=Glarea lozoyensis (strain ATCC 74030 / MF5533) TaxID=1104152 RepID=H0EZ80_GLAL7|nr:hypothetical protein M7I_8142 [Glarea lozoyensis 74030]